jgi:hypothetical protein
VEEIGMDNYFLKRTKIAQDTREGKDKCDHIKLKSF